MSVERIVIVDIDSPPADRVGIVVILLDGDSNSR